MDRRTAEQHIHNLHGLSPEYVQAAVEELGAGALTDQAVIWIAEQQLSAASRQGAELIRTAAYQDQHPGMGWEDAKTAVKMDSASEQTSEWIIRRCTQQWAGNELQYQDWGPYGPGTMTPLTKAEMMEALEVFQRRWPDHEFAGHNVLNCKCAEHATLKSVGEAAARAR